MKRLFFFVMALCSATMISMTSCNNEDEMQQSDDLKEALETRIVKRCEVAKALQSISIDDALMQEIHAFVTNALSSGRDEEISFKKMLTNDEQTRSSGSSVMKERLTRLVSESVTRADNGETTFDTAWLRGLINSDVIIYWPYSEDWDGKELPTIVVAPDNEDAEKAEGFRMLLNKNGYAFETVLVDEDYALSHPVWVINEKEDNPNVKYIPTTDSDTEETLVTRSSGNPIWVWKLTRMKVTRQYDGIFAGGSEMDIQIAYPSLNGYVQMTTHYRISFSRKAIRNETWKNLTEVLNTNWRTEQIQNGILLSEYDGGGGSRNYSYTIEYQTGENTTTQMAMQLSIEENDDFIATQVIDRDYALGHSDYSYDGGGVRLIALLMAE